MRSLSYPIPACWTTWDGRVIFSDGTLMRQHPTGLQSMLPRTQAYVHVVFLVSLIPWAFSQALCSACALVSAAV